MMQGNAQDAKKDSRNIERTANAAERQVEAMEDLHRRLPNLGAMA
jgi:hypothetical protein